MHGKCAPVDHEDMAREPRLFKLLCGFDTLKGCWQPEKGHPMMANSEITMIHGGSLRSINHLLLKPPGPSAGLWQRSGHGPLILPYIRI
eukprot:853596-Pelagomonas_calceolata.AAC.4